MTIDRYSFVASSRRRNREVEEKEVDSSSEAQHPLFGESNSECVEDSGSIAESRVQELRVREIFPSLNYFFSFFKSMRSNREYRVLVPVDSFCNCIRNKNSDELWNSLVSFGGERVLYASVVSSPKGLRSFYSCSYLECVLEKHMESFIENETGEDYPSPNNDFLSRTISDVLEVWSCHGYKGFVREVRKHLRVWKYFCFLFSLWDNIVKQGPSNISVQLMQSIRDDMSRVFCDKASSPLWSQEIWRDEFREMGQEIFARMELESPDKVSVIRRMSSSWDRVISRSS